MRPTTTLQRVMADVTVGTHRAMRSREKQTMYYKLSERDHQFQFPISGTVGLVPVETTIDIKFDIRLLFEYGYLRDSQLLEPLTRFGFTSVIAPYGTIPYAHVSSWVQDEDLNYIGAKVVVGVHNPAISASGTSTLTSASFKATLHCSFQGYGTPIDPDDSSDNPSVDTTSSGVAAIIAPPAPPAVVVPVVPAVFAAGPLGGSSGWTVVESYTGGSIDSFQIPAGEGALIINDAGLVTAKDPSDVSVLTIPTVVPPIGPVLDGVVYGTGTGGILKPGSSQGDKYAANWIAPGKVRDQYKIRWKMEIQDFKSVDSIYSVTIGMKDRQHGLAFPFGTGLTYGTASWTNDLRGLGNVQTGDGVNGQVPKNTWSVANAASDFGVETNALANFGVDPAALLLAETQLDQQMPPEVWVELWRNSGYLVVGIYSADPDSGAKPLLVSATDVSQSADYGPTADVYFGFTRNKFGSDNGSGPGRNGSDAHNIQGISEITLYKR